MKKRKAIYPGSFDPVTFGHLDVIERALEQFDELVILVAANPSKKTLFSVAERVDFLKRALKRQPRARVAAWQGLTVDFAAKEKACALIRGLRATSDFDYEFQMALTNRQLAPTVDTVFLMPSESHFYLSSRLIKEIAQVRGNVTAYVPGPVAVKLRQKFSIKGNSFKNEIHSR
ncbi:MAG TPA: pantetheine-phosphate adenylyltransferase [Candidatus Omnitrophota bacterium]|nr:pantetheine-phosphate adenylyltransferase [Candidatus Omnitrophota bacterium]HPS37486.1 pantetheine-phosphate adenylyltransferase [Candidatus Omnitrophota bacterium]